LEKRAEWMIGLMMTGMGRCSVVIQKLSPRWCGVTAANSPPALLTTHGMCAELSSWKLTSTYSHES
jgi:hypothetical protein